MGAAFRRKLSRAVRLSPTTCSASRAPLPAEQLFTFRDSLYGFIAVALGDYAAAARIISPKWDTVAMPTGDFRRLARPLVELLGLR